MENIVKVDVIKKFVIFICLLIFVLITMDLVLSMFDPYGFYYLFMNIEDTIIILFLLIIVVVIAKYVGDIVITALKSKNRKQQTQPIAEGFKICPKCNERIGTNVQFCSSCGTKQ